MSLDELGLHTQLLVAGFAGGVAHAFAFKQTSPIAQVGSVIMGTVTANYFGPVVAQLPYVGDKLGVGASAFAVGISAMAIIQGVAAVVESRMARAKRNITQGKEP
jgi:hypothetical protein